MRYCYIEISWYSIITQSKVGHCNLLNSHSTRIQYSSTTHCFVAAAKQCGIDLQEIQLQRPTCHNLLLVTTFYLLQIFKMQYIFKRANCKEKLITTSQIQLNIFDTTLC